LDTGYREERVAKNEAISRRLNEGIEAAFESDPQDTYHHLRVVWSNATGTVRITKAEYERVRGDPRQFVIYREHLIPDVEKVLIEGDRFLLVAKREGTPAEVAIQEDPRT
jgi:hypothetical protein